jgi:hypothetical protein
MVSAVEPDLVATLTQVLSGSIMSRMAERVAESVLGELDAGTGTLGEEVMLRSSCCNLTPESTLTSLKLWIRSSNSDLEIRCLPSPLGKTGFA